MSAQPDNGRSGKGVSHVKNTVSGARLKAARFNEPITATKQTLFTLADTRQRPYECVHVPFQSTLSTNIPTANALNSNKLFVVMKERGKGVTKRKWGIEMNEARQLYRKTYRRIDTIESLIGSCHIYYQSWNYWHSAKDHGMLLAILVAYDMYKECAERARSVPGGNLWTFTLSRTSCQQHKGLNTRKSSDDILVIEP